MGVQGTGCYRDRYQALPRPVVTASVMLLLPGSSELVDRWIEIIEGAAGIGAL